MTTQADINGTDGGWASAGGWDDPVPYEPPAAPEPEDSGAGGGWASWDNNQQADDVQPAAADATEDSGRGWGNETAATVVNSSFDRQSSVTSAQQPSAVDSVAGEVSNEHQLKAVALYTFESQNADELTVTENEQVTVLLGKSNGFISTIAIFPFLVCRYFNIFGP